MAAVDAAWLHMDRPTNELIVNAVLWFDDELPDELVRHTVAQRLVARHERFSQRVEDTGRVAWWVDQDGFDPMSNVVRDRLPGPGGLAELGAHVTAIVSQPLPRDAPLWRIHVIDGYEGGTALLARIHHCIADGVALFRVLLGMSDEASEQPADFASGMRGRASIVPAPAADAVARIGAVASSALKAASAVAGLVLLPPDRRTTLRDPLSGAKTVRWSEPMPIDPIKIAARAAGATVNDIVLAGLGEAVHRYLSETGDTARDVRAILPVDLRGRDPHAAELGNHFGLVFLRLPTATADSAERLATIRRRTTALKASATPVVALQILRLAGRLPRRLVSLLISVFSAKASAVVTNVPGPTHALHLGGHRLAGLIAWPPQSGSIGVGVAVISYAGRLVVGVISDDGAVPDSSRLLADLRSSLLAIGAQPALAP